MLTCLQLWSATLYVLPIRMHHRSEYALSMAAIEMHFVVNMFRVFPYVLDLIFSPQPNCISLPGAKGRPPEQRGEIITIYAACAQPTDIFPAFTGQQIYPP